MAQDFMKVKCKCKNEQVIFSRPAIVVKCLVCNEVLAEPRGAKANVKAEVIIPKVA
ncbi:MAG TPA: 30S ribosomal protein S27e [archaeon]|nr:30S ribosomal protein S27e [archaeon]